MIAVPWSEYISISLLIFWVVLALSISVNLPSVHLVLGKAVARPIIAVLAVLLVAQSTHVFAHFSGHDVLLQTVETAFLLIWPTLSCGAVWIIWCMSMQARAHQDTHNWLMQVYSNMSCAIFVLKDDHIIYANPSFNALQKQFHSDNPFGDVELNQQEVALCAVNGERFVFNVDQFSLSAFQGDAFMATDITLAKFQNSFIQKVATDLNAQSTGTMKSILALIYELVPHAILYVGEYSADIDGYRYVTHQGEDKRYIFTDLKLNDASFKTNDWSWFNIEKEPQAIPPDFVPHSLSPCYGGIILRDSVKAPLGVILVMRMCEDQLSRVLLDFLSIFSIRVRSELAHRQDKRHIEQSSNRYRAFIKSSNEAIADIMVQPSVYIDESINEQWDNINKNAKLNEVNPAFMSLFQFTKQPTTHDFFNMKSLKNLMQYVLESGYNSEVIEVPHENEYGDIQWLSCRVMADIEERRLHRLWVILRDITDSKNHIQHLKHQNRYDNLTGLANRTALREHLEEKIEQACQFGLKSALILIDLDQFKEVNDALGHHYGDVLLKKIEPRLRDIINQKRAFLARLGGDEFAIVVSSVEGTDEMHEMAIEIVKKLREPFDLGQLHVEIGCSIGISFYPNDGAEASNIMRCADVAMYKAKQDTSRILHYNTEMDVSSPRRLALMTDMNKGLRNNEFFLVFQPKLNLETNQVHAAEALLRWQHESLGLIGPTEFIPLAEMSDVIIGMTHWVIDNTLGQLKKWMDEDIHIKTSVNVSMRSLLNDDLPGFIKAKLAEHQVPADLFEIEITESALMCDPERALNTLRLISAMGVRISVDDFGIGYSSFIYLRQLPVDTLKIDIMFVRNMCANSQDEIIVNSIVNLGHNLALTVVAEGAEDLPTIERLTAINCDMAQGYFISKPVLPDAFIVLHKTWGKDA